MIISVNWLKKFVADLPPVEELVKIIGARLVEVEDVTNLNEKYKDVLVVKVVSAQKVEGSDHLNLCKIDDGGKRQGIERDDNGLIQVVCGAPNMRAGLFVAWLPPASIVPETFGKEDFILGSRKLMGNMSNGMIASIKELDLGEEHDGILEITNDITNKELCAGDSFSEIFGLDDYLIEVENKSLTHRPDCFGNIGFAREVAGILGKKFKEPLCLNTDSIVEGTNNEISIDIKDDKLCSSYALATFDAVNLKKQESLSIEKSFLHRSGVKAIDPITDLANFIMLEVGQPLHTFDLDKLKKLHGSKDIKITIRNAFQNEKIVVLGNKEISLTENDIVIAVGSEGQHAVAIAGAIGGEATKIDNSTKRILVESATFSLYNLRNTQMRHGIFSEAITRFTKGIPKMLNVVALKKFAEKSQQIGLSQSSNILINSLKNKTQELSVNVEKINNILGTNFSIDDISETLLNVGFKTQKQGENAINIVIPFWRTDIHIMEDIAEEVGRLKGYDNISLTLPKRTFKPVELSNIDKIRMEIREILSSAGANEVLTYSFIHKKLLENVYQDENNSYKIINSISPDLQYYRQTILPSLLDKVNSNVRSGYNEFVIFEINKVTRKDMGIRDNVPVEEYRLALAYTNKDSEEAFYNAKHYLEFLLRKLGIELVVKPFNISEAPLAGKFEPKRSALVGYYEHDSSFVMIGAIGEFKKSVQRSFKLPKATAGFEIVIDKIIDQWLERKMNIELPSKFQSIERDISIRVNNKVSYDDLLKSLENKINKINNECAIKIKPVDIYRYDQDNKNITFRFKISPYDRTFNGEDINKIITALQDSIIKLGTII